MKNISLGKFLIIVVGIILLFRIIGNITAEKSEVKETSQIKQSPIINYMGKDYFENWREPTTDELAKISSVLIRQQTRQCANFYVIETSANEYAVACTPDEKTFKYYGVWTSAQKSGELSADIIKVYSEPNHIRYIEKTRLPPHD